MIQLLPKCDILTPNTANLQEITEFIFSYIDSHRCETISIDISYLNILDACNITVMCGTKHFIKYPEGQINWLVSSECVYEYTKNMNLGNNIFTVVK